MLIGRLMCNCERLRYSGAFLFSENKRIMSSGFSGYNNNNRGMFRYNNEMLNEEKGEDAFDTTKMEKF